MKKIMLLYVPVLHEGYDRLFKKYASKVESLFILGADLIEELTYLEPEIRAFNPDKMRKAIEGLGYFKHVGIVHRDELGGEQRLSGHSTFWIWKDADIITADEGISRRLIERYFQGRNVEFLPVFLRWDEQNVFSERNVSYDRVSTDSFDQEMIRRAASFAEKGSDWWRRVGAVVVRDRAILLEERNRHVPSEHVQYAYGDPRDFIRAGASSEISTALHAEAGVIAKAAKLGISLSGADIYQTVFPCPVCAKLIAAAGFRSCLFGSGHASLDGETVLRAARVEIIFVKGI